MIQAERFGEALRKSLQNLGSEDVSFSLSFKRAFKRLIRRQPELQEQIEERLILLAADPFNPLLQTHKLKGKLAGACACSIEYDCRIVFNFIENSESGEEEMLLIDIGTHDEVY